MFDPFIPFFDLCVYMMHEKTYAFHPHRPDVNWACITMEHCRPRSTILFQEEYDIGTGNQSTPLISFTGLRIPQDSVFTSIIVNNEDGCPLKEKETERSAHMKGEKLCCLCPPKYMSGGQIPIMPLTFKKSSVDGRSHMDHFHVTC